MAEATSKVPVKVEEKTPARETALRALNLDTASWTLICS